MSNNVPRNDPLDPQEQHRRHRERSRGFRGAELHETEVSASYLNGVRLDDSFAPGGGQSYVYNSEADAFLLQDVVSVAAGGGGSGSSAHSILSTTHSDSDFGDTPQPGDVLTYTGVVWTGSAPAAGGTGGGHVIAEDGAGLTQRSTMNFVDTDTVVASDAGGLTQVQLGSYVLRQGRATDQTVAGGTTATSSLSLRGGATGSSGTVQIVSSDFQIATNGKRFTNSAGNEALRFQTATPHVVVTGDLQVVPTGTGTTGFILLSEISDPATPASGFAKLYAKDSGGTSGLFYRRDDGTVIGPLGTGGGGAGVTDHGALTGLDPDDDHTQYAFLAGRATGQTLIGGTAASGDLILQSTSHATRRLVTLADAISFPGDITPSQITADQTDYAPTGIGGASVVRLTSDAAGWLIKSLDATGVGGTQQDGRVVTLHNDNTTANRTIILQDAASTGTAAWRFALPQASNVPVYPRESADVIYDSTTTRWKLKSMGGKPPHTTGSHLGSVTVESRYVFTTNQGNDTDIIADAPHGPYLATNNQGGSEVITRIVHAAENAGTGSLVIQPEQGSTDDLDTATWSAIDTNTMGSAVRGLVVTSSFTLGTLSPNRLLRLNIGTATGSWQNASIVMYTTYTQSVSVSAT